MKRITPEEVKAAYEATGMKPTTSTVGFGKCRECCGLGALGRVHGLSPVHIYNWAVGTYGADYTESFVYGFDNWDAPTLDLTDADPTAVDDGRAAAALVFGESAVA